MNRHLHLDACLFVVYLLFFIYRTDNVAKAFLVLVKDETKNGEALMVHVDGAAFYSFPKQIKDYPSTKVNLQ